MHFLQKLQTIILIFLKNFLANQMENIPSQEETSLGVLDHDAVRSYLEELAKKRSEYMLPVQMKSATVLAKMLRIMDPLLL